MSSTKDVFWVGSEKVAILASKLADKFDLCATAERILTKLYKEQVLNILLQVCVFWTIVVCTYHQLIYTFSVAVYLT